MSFKRPPKPLRSRIVGSQHARPHACNSGMQDPNAASSASASACAEIFAASHAPGPVAQQVDYAARAGRGDQRQAGGSGFKESIRHSLVARGEHKQRCAGKTRVGLCRDGLGSRPRSANRAQRPVALRADSSAPAPAMSKSALGKRPRTERTPARAGRILFGARAGPWPADAAPCRSIAEDLLSAPVRIPSTSTGWAAPRSARARGEARRQVGGHGAGLADHTIGVAIKQPVEQARVAWQSAAGQRRQRLSCFVARPHGLRQERAGAAVEPGSSDAPFQRELRLASARRTRRRRRTAPGANPAGIRVRGL